MHIPTPESQEQDGSESEVSLGSIVRLTWRRMKSVGGGRGNEGEESEGERMIHVLG